MACLLKHKESQQQQQKRIIKTYIIKVTFNLILNSAFIILYHIPLDVKIEEPLILQSFF